MSAPGPLHALLERWYRRAVEVLEESRSHDGYDRGERKGQAHALYHCARELEDVIETVRRG